MLIKALPRDALVRTPESERGRDPWTAELELMAQLLEVTSIGVAQMKLRKPIKVPRPKDREKKAAAKAAVRTTARTTAAPGDNPYRAAIRAFGVTQPARLREQAAEVVGSSAGRSMVPARSGGDDPSYGAAIARFSATQPARLRVVRDGERSRQ